MAIIRISATKETIKREPAGGHRYGVPVPVSMKRVERRNRQTEGDTPKSVAIN